MICDSPKITLTHSVEQLFSKDHRRLFLRCGIWIAGFRPAWCQLGVPIWGRPFKVVFNLQDHLLIHILLFPHFHSLGAGCWRRWVGILFVIWQLARLWQTNSFDTCTWSSAGRPRRFESKGLSPRVSACDLALRPQNEKCRIESIDNPRSVLIRGFGAFGLIARLAVVLNASLNSLNSFSNGPSNRLI